MSRTVLRNLGFAVAILVASLVALIVFLCVPRFADASNNRQAVPVSAFIDSIGVNTHVNFTGPDYSGYAHTKVAIDSLRYLGVRHVRDGGRSFTPDQVARLVAVAKGADARLTLTPGSGGPVDLTAFHKGLLDLEAARPGILAAIEGPNEINNVFMHEHWNVVYKGKKSDMCARDFGPSKALQQDLYGLVKSDPVLKDIPVFNYTVVYLKKGIGEPGCQADFDADMKAIGTQAAADFGNIHEYAFQGAPPRQVLLKALARKTVTPGKPVVITETGFATDENDTARPKLSVSETVQAKYTLNTLFDGFTLGARRTYLYQLLDNAPDVPATTIEKHFGLFYADGRPKPAAVALHNLMQILTRSDGAGPGQTEALVYTLKAPAGLQDTQLLLQKADGSYVLVLWAEPPIWNAGTQTDMAVKAETVSITLAKSAGRIRVYDPLAGTGPIETASHARKIDVKISDHPVLIEFN
jgi:trimeric autotransporter adhesin